MPAMQTIKLTAKQYFQMGEDPPGVRFELVDGEIEISPGPPVVHAYCITMLGMTLVKYLEVPLLVLILGHVDIELDEYNVRRPDLLYFSEARRHLAGRDRLRGLPDLAIEVVSPSSGKIDRETKFGEYQRAGIEHYWIIDLELRTFVAYSLRDGRYEQHTQGSEKDVVNALPFEALDVPLGNLWMQ